MGNQQTSRKNINETMTSTLSHHMKNDATGTTNSSSSSNDDALRDKIMELKRQLQLAKKEWNNNNNNHNNGDDILNDDEEDDNGLSSSIVLPPPGKSGYLFKWQDRSIGWGGTKWALRFVSLDRGRISYYYSHLENSPRYVLSLRGCTIQDEGWKRNRRHKGGITRMTKDGQPDPPLEEAGAYFFVFSICHRPHVDAAMEHRSSTKSKMATSATRSSSSMMTNPSVEFVPLIRFSTPSWAEKTQWIQLLSEACAYGETETFLQEEATRNAQEEDRRRQQAELAAAMPQAERGTLAPIYFAPTQHHHPSEKKRTSGTGATPTTKRTGLVRRPSLTKLPKASLYRIEAKSRDADKVESAIHGYPPSKPMHRESGVSFLSTEASEQNYRGFFNLAMIILIVSNFRLLLQTFQHHGFVMADLLGKLFTSTDSNKSANDNHDTSNGTPHYDFEANMRAFLFGMVCLQGFLITTYFLEWCLSRRRHRLPDSIGNVLHHINAHMSLLASIVIVWYWIEIPPLGACLLFNAVIVWMKLLSYVLANEDYRASWVAALAEASDASLTSSSVSSSPSSESSSTLGGQNTTATNAMRAYDAHQATLALIDSLDSDDLDIAYPRNITLMNIYYFWLAPTLTYQIAFPKTPRVRFFKVIGILIRMVLVFSLFVFFSVQVVGPTLEHLLTDLEATQGQYTLQILADYWLKLTITNTYLWLLMFYFYFHLYLNLFAELLRFGDRVFYKDWWNSVEVSAYWRLWNLPVHYWMVRHLYFPCVRRNISKTGATFLVFFFSAVVHELLVSIPFHMLRPWLFWGMMGQFPLIFISKWFCRQFPGSSIGNIIFWLSFCVVGQPMAIMMYTIDFKYGKLHGASGSAAASGVASAAMAELAEKVMGSMVDPTVSEL